jgi:carbamoyltransferase
MRILGLSSFEHDTAAAMLQGGRVTGSIENDKLMRSLTHGLPEAAIRFCMGTTTGWNDLSLVAVATRSPQSWFRTIASRTRRSPQEAANTDSTRSNETLARELNRLLAQPTLAVSAQRILSFDHQLCHAASTFFLSPFERALILILDEDGGGDLGMLAIGEGNAIRVLQKLEFRHSPSWAYSQITDLIGFTAHREEHKTQWLSLEGEPVYKDIMLRMLRQPGSSLRHLDYGFSQGGLTSRLPLSSKFYREVGLPKDSGQLNEQQRRVIASSIQAACTELVMQLIHNFRCREHIQQICLGGGLFQNAILVASLEKALGNNEVFVPPAPGNPGTSVGAAYLAWHHTLHQPRTEPVGHAYWGPSFDRHQIKEVLDNSKSRYLYQNTEERKLDAAVQLLQADKVIGWVQGAAEFGSRALGNRSVLASPYGPYVRENLNDFIKHREWYRPFTISVPEEDSSQYFEASHLCRFMNSLAPVRSETSCLPKIFFLPGERVRLHVVGRSVKPRFWNLLKRFGEHAPAPMLLNTSFNLFGEPLVVTPRDAIRSYFCSGIDALVSDRQFRALEE